MLRKISTFDVVAIIIVIVGAAISVGVMVAILEGVSYVSYK